MKLEVIEQSGKWINTIVNYYDEDIFVFTDKYLQVNLPYNKEALCEAINNLEKIIIKILLENPYITRKELKEKTKRSDASIYRIITILKKNGIIIRIGSRKKGLWKIKK